MLDQLAEYRVQHDAIVLEKQAMLDAILTAEIKARMAEIEAKFAPKIECVIVNISTLEAEIKHAVIKYGASVKAAALQAVFTPGRVTWDTKGLEGYMVAHPEVRIFRKEGEPSVSIRAVK